MQKKRSQQQKLFMPCAQKILAQSRFPHPECYVSHSYNNDTCVSLVSRYSFPATTTCTLFPF